MIETARLEKTRKRIYLDGALNAEVASTENLLERASTGSGETAVWRITQYYKGVGRFAALTGIAG